jgi:endoglucanase
MKGTRWKINKLECFEAPGLSILVFHNFYPQGKQGGLEIIQHGERIATNGDLRLEPAPGQWSMLPKVGKREANVKRGTITVPLSFPEHNLDYVIRVEAEGDSLLVSVDLTRPLPRQLEGKASFNLELFPSAYFGKTFHLGSTFGVFPKQANGPMILKPDREMEPASMATGSRLSIATEDPLREMVIEQISGGEMSLLDGRNTAHNGWFIVRSLLPMNVTKGAFQWRITLNSIPEWRRRPVIGVSQVGYHPSQKKRAVIELDARTKNIGEATILRVDPKKGLSKVFSAQPKMWGKFLRYNYAIFDFTHICDPGMYMIQFESESTYPFQISQDIYSNGVWQPTLETYFPVQMCHMKVCDRYQVWHGACHLDDALQAPPRHEHFDGYRQGPTTDTPYSADQHIPGLNRGGWHDAGDYDLAAGSQAQTTFALALAKEEFNVETDQTTANEDKRLVLLHTPDGVPDIVQQVAHGVENLLSGYRAVGHSFSGIIERNMTQYVHLGDGSVITDNRIYDPNLSPDEVSGEHSGNLDDRWVFTNHDTALEYKVITSLAAASRVLRGYNGNLAQECLNTAVKAWEYEQAHSPVALRSAYSYSQEPQEIFAAVELLITTREDRYRKRLISLLPRISDNIERVGWAVSRALPLIKDDNFAANVKEAIKKYKSRLDEELKKNPYHVPFTPSVYGGVWGFAWNILESALEQYYLMKKYPELFNQENLFAAVHYVLGCHPGSNVSLVSGVGAHSLTTAYGANRADWSYIPGGVISGTAVIRPDFPELKDNFPFLWQQSENVISGSAAYIFCVLAAEKLLKNKEKNKPIKPLDR